jgi:hypothetical protein
MAKKKAPKGKAKDAGVAIIVAPVGKKGMPPPFAKKGKGGGKCPDCGGKMKGGKCPDCGYTEK